MCRVRMRGLFFRGALAAQILAHSFDLVPGIGPIIVVTSVAIRWAGFWIPTV